MACAVETTFSYADANDLTYDTDLVETAGGVTRLKAYNLSLGALYETPGNANADYAIDSATGSLQNGATVSGGALQCAGAAGRFVVYAAANAFEALQVGTVKLLWTPNYTGAPPTNNFLFNIAGTPSDKNQIMVYHQFTGALTVVIKNQSGQFVVNYNVPGGFSAVAGQTYEVALCWDLANGATRLFIDGTQVGATQTGTGTRSNSIIYFRVGNRTAADTAYHAIEEFTLHAEVLYEADYTYTEGESPILVTRSAPTVVTDGAILTSEVEEFTEIVSEPSPSDVRWVLRVNGTDKWWDGAAWSDSDGTYAQTNDAATINTNASALALSPLGTQVRPVAFLGSTDGIAVPTITSCTFGYCLVVAEPDAPRECVVYGFDQLIDGTNRVGVEIYVEALFGFTHGAHIQRSGPDGRISGTTDAEGRIQFQLVETETINLSPYQFVIDDGGDSLPDTYGPIQVPDAVQVAFGDLIARSS